MNPSPQAPATAPQSEAEAIAALPTDVIINGGQKITVRYKDGRTEEVLVRITPISKMADYLTKIGEPTMFAEFTCGQAKGWGDNLSEDSVYEIDEIARKLNRPGLARFLKRQETMLKELGPTSKGLAAYMSSLPTR